jgi:hypothetical protein
MKRLLAAGFAIFTLTACHTQRTYTASSFGELREDLQAAIRREIGDAEIVSVRPTTVAGNAGYYQVDYISDGQHKSLKVNDQATFLSKSDWGYTIEEAAGAERNP